MRLMNTQTLQLTEFISDDETPPYTILSHTWEREEVIYQQWESKEITDISHMKGYVKIKNFAERAAADGFSWIWVDT